MIHVNVNLHANFHPHTSRASPIPVNALRSFWGSPVDGFFMASQQWPLSLLSWAPLACPFPLLCQCPTSRVHSHQGGASRSSQGFKSQEARAVLFLHRDRQNGPLSLFTYGRWAPKKVSLSLGVPRGPLYFL